MRTIIITLTALFFYSCQTEIDPSILNTNTNTTDSVATFVLAGSPTTCSHVVPVGTYKKNTPLTSSNKISVEVSVSKTGSWQANTNTVNGISFSGTGQFTSSGIQTIVLQGSGLPSQSGAVTFNISAGSNTCSFVLNIDTSTSAPPTGNIPPIANAGSDQSITLPTNSVTLKGSGSDADGTITSYLWTKIAGPSTGSIATPNQTQTTVNSLVQGTYQFELKVTDNLGAIGKDTVSVVVSAQAASGTLGIEQSLYAVITPLNTIFNYDGTGKIIKITSNNYPERRITYTNNKIATVEYWYGDPNIAGTYYKGQTNAYVYDGSGNVITINQTDNISGKTFVFAEFTYNSDNTMKTKKLFFDTGQPFVNNAFTYKNGNLTGFIEEANTSNPDTTFVTYDTRTNNFRTIYPQFYFIDTQTDFEQTYRSEIFYFSNNYPTDFGGLPVSVSTTSGQKPFEVKFDNQLWYRYIYN